jgi:hypothetical protein
VEYNIYFHHLNTHHHEFPETRPLHLLDETQTPEHRHRHRHANDRLDLRRSPEARNDSPRQSLGEGQRRGILSDRSDLHPHGFWGHWCAGGHEGYSNRPHSLGNESQAGRRHRFHRQRKTSDPDAAKGAELATLAAAEQSNIAYQTRLAQETARANEAERQRVAVQAAQEAVRAAAAATPAAPAASAYTPPSGSGGGIKGTSLDEKPKAAGKVTRQ